MNNVDLLTSALVADPLNPIIAAMLNDELQDARDMLPTEATRHVVRVAADGCRLQQLQSAAELLVTDCPDRTHVLTNLSALCGFIDLAQTTVFVVEGDGEPVLTVRAGGSKRCYWPDRTVLVGAGWLMAQLHDGSR